MGRLERVRRSHISRAASAGILVACLLLLTACAGSGSLDWNQVRQLKVGMSEAELLKAVGQPYQVVSKDDGTQIWIWVHVNAFAETQSMSVSLRDGKVAQIPIIPDSFK